MMKNRNWHILPLLLLLLAMLTTPVQASEYRCVFDEAFLLSTPEAEALDQAAADISVRYGCGVYIVTLPDYAPYGTDVRNAAENYFLNHEHMQVLHKIQPPEQLLMLNRLNLEK